MEVNTNPNGALERRKQADRRQSPSLPQYPFYDSSGSLVTRDRRSAPDRRLSHIQVEWISDISLQTLK